MVREASSNSSASARARVNPDDSLTKQASIPLTPLQATNRVPGRQQRAINKLQMSVHKLLVASSLSTLRMPCLLPELTEDAHTVQPSTTENGHERTTSIKIPLREYVSIFAHGMEVRCVCRVCGNRALGAGCSRRRNAARADDPGAGSAARVL